MEFYRRAKEIGAETEEDRLQLLLAMADEGKLVRVSQTNRTKAKYIEDISKNFNVWDLTQREENDGTNE